jgi:radical SAM protein with 4Fe4S-binding SPASM domain
MAVMATPSHIKRVAKQNLEEILAEALGPRFHERFFTYRRAYHVTLENDHSFIPYFPISVLLELHNRCNLDCLMCHSAHRSGARVAIDETTLDRLFAEFKQHALPAIMFGAGDEPLMYKTFDQVLSRASQAEIMDIFVFTNGTLLTPDKAEMLLQAGVTRLFISLDAASEETYGRIRRRNGELISPNLNRLEQVEKNIKGALKLRADRQAVLPLVRVSFVVQQDNVHEIEAFCDKWSDTADSVELQAHSNYDVIGQLAEIPEEERWRPVEPALGEPPLLCSQPFNTVTVWYDGMVSPCCEFMGRNLTVGNVAKETVKEIWHGEKITELRKQFQSGKLNPVCRACLLRREAELFSGADAKVPHPDAD